MENAVVVIGSLPVDCLRLGEMASEFGWTLEIAADLVHLEAISMDSVPVVVLFDSSSLHAPCQQTLQTILAVAPGALPIVCQRFSDAISWPDLAQAGAFHSLRLPFDPREVRQSLGFAWSVQCARSKNPALPPRLARIPVPFRARAIGNVA
jgi:DNA-binding NtrC family response regulator